MMPYWYIFANNISWSTQTNAFCKSQKLPPTISLLFSAMSISLIRIKDGRYVDDPLLNLNYSLVSILLQLQCLSYFMCICLSNIFEKVGNSDIAL